MARMRKRLIEDFLIPALNSEKYGMRMYWLNKEKGIFRIYWSHKNAAKWSADDTIVFQDWDKLKGHFKPNVKNYYMCSKQRFRAALYKLSPYIRQLKCPEKFHRDYQLIMDGNKKLGEYVARCKLKTPKKANQSAIPTSVIRENTSYIAKPELKEETPISQSPRFTPADIQIFQQYSSSMEKRNQIKMGRQNVNKSSDNICQKSLRDVHEASVLRENSSTPRVPHVAAQAIPTFCSFKQYQSRHHSFDAVPEIFVSKIYVGPENIPQRQEDTQSSAFIDDMNSGILNLSVRSDTSSNAPSR